MVPRLLRQFTSFIRNVPFRRIYIANAALMPQFRAETHEFLIERMRVLGTVGPVLYMSFSVLDYIRYPDYFGSFIAMRAVTSFLVGLAVVLSYTTFGRRHFTLITSLAVQVCCHTISMMTAVLNGFEDIYFVGNVLIILLAGMFLPWRPVQAIVTCTLICAFFAGINLLYHPASVAMATPMFFMIGASIFTVVSVISMEISRLRELVIRVEVQRAHNEIKKEISAARSIQRSLLPAFVQDFPGARLEALYHPCEDLSGDFFDTIVSGEWLYIYVADVTSHGTAAAQITYLVKELVSQLLAHAPGIDLNALFERICKRYAEMNLNYDLGFQLVRYHVHSRRIEYLRSNAPEAVLVTAGRAQELSARPSSVISSLSLAADFRAYVAQRQMNAGESIYFYTDGAAEFPMNDGRQFGERKFKAALLNCHLQAWPDSLIANLKSSAEGRSFPDDITIIRIRVL